MSIIAAVLFGLAIEPNWAGGFLGGSVALACISARALWATR